MRLRGDPPPLRPEPRPSELRALRAYLEAGSTRLAAERLGIAESTLKNELSTMRSRIGVHNTAQAVLVLYDKLVA